MQPRNLTMMKCQLRSLRGAFVASPGMPITWCALRITLDALRPYVLDQPHIWFHEVFYADGRPYRQREISLIRELTGRGSRN